MENRFYYCSPVEEIVSPGGFLTPLWEELYRSFTYTKGAFRAVIGEECRLSFGSPVFGTLGEGEEYLVTVRPDGIGLVARDRATLARAFSTLLMRMLPSDRADSVCRIPVGDVPGNFSVRDRYAHICVFPETNYFETLRRVRLLGMLQYTHLIVEFWGTFPFPSFPEACWEEYCFTKEQVCSLVRDGKTLGLEMIPDFNCLGHASASRQMYGKHVVLDVHPELADLYTPDGWCWNFFNPTVFPLLHRMREDMVRLFDHPRYFHLGCDEAYLYRNGYLPDKTVASYYRALTTDVEEAGMIPLIWGDALVPASLGGESNTTDERAELFLAALSPNTVICHWDYNLTSVPIAATEYFAKSGHPVITCAARKHDNIRAHITQAKESNVGFMLTTWHWWLDTPILPTARLMGLPDNTWSPMCTPYGEFAVLTRKVLPGRRYADFGFSAKQV